MCRLNYHRRACCYNVVVREMVHFVYRDEGSRAIICHRRYGCLTYIERPQFYRNNMSATAEGGEVFLLPAKLGMQ